MRGRARGGGGGVWWAGGVECASAHGHTHNAAAAWSRYGGRVRSHLRVFAGGQRWQCTAARLAARSGHDETAARLRQNCAMGDGAGATELYADCKLTPLHT
jgi:hypothetical protein